MDEEPPPIPVFLIEEIKFLRARGVEVLISEDGGLLRYWIQGEEVFETDIIAQAYMLGMPGPDHLQ